VTGRPEDRPTTGPVAHVFVLGDDGRCVCSMPLFSGVHVARPDEVRLPDLTEVAETSAAAAAALTALAAAITDATTRSTP
jgi:hypothetical protein